VYALEMSGKWLLAYGIVGVGGGLIGILLWFLLRHRIRSTARAEVFQHAERLLEESRAFRCLYEREMASLQQEVIAMRMGIADDAIASRTAALRAEAARAPSRHIPAESSMGAPMTSRVSFGGTH
jgi:hypothetical protein